MHALLSQNALWYILGEAESKQAPIAALAADSGSERESTTVATDLDRARAVYKGGNRLLNNLISLPILYYSSFEARHSSCEKSKSLATWSIPNGTPIRQR